MYSILCRIRLRSAQNGITQYKGVGSTQPTLLVLPVRPTSQPNNPCGLTLLSSIYLLLSLTIIWLLSFILCTSSKHPLDILWTSFVHPLNTILCPLWPYYLLYPSISPVSLSHLNFLALFILLFSARTAKRPCLLHVHKNSVNILACPHTICLLVCA